MKMYKKYSPTINAVLLSLFLLLAMSDCATVEEPVFGGTVIDVQGNVYHTVTLGKQTWMIENLKTTVLNNGTAIPLLTDSSAWASVGQPGYCWYNKSDSLAAAHTYGALYNWYVVHSGLLAPKGWHIPSVREWTQLEETIAAYYNKSGSLAKILASKTGWERSTVGASIGNDFSKNNTSGMDAKASGYRADSTAVFEGKGIKAFWWASNQKDSVKAYRISVSYNLSAVETGFAKFGNGFSVRCIKDSI
ncbi:MAG: Chitodextrinase precursor [Bacteroidota bacterium]